jgi:uncharacterized membrane protein (UPF0136 family)
MVLVGQLAILVQLVTLAILAIMALVVLVVQPAPRGIQVRRVIPATLVTTALEVLAVRLELLVTLAL